MAIWTGHARTNLSDSIFEFYREVYNACESIIAGTLSVRAIYDMVLTRRVELLRDQNVRVYHVEDRREDRALIRLLCMGNVAMADEDSYMKMLDVLWKIRPKKL